MDIKSVTEIVIATGSAVIALRALQKSSASSISEILKDKLEARAIESWPVRIVGDGEPEIAEVWEALAARKFSDLKIVPRATWSASSREIAILILPMVDGPLTEAGKSTRVPAFDAVAWQRASGSMCGIIYIKGQAPFLRGDWGFANALHTLYTNLSAMIKYKRAAA